MALDNVIPERNQRKKDQEFEARLRELEQAPLPELLETIRDDELLMRRKQATMPLRLKAIRVVASRGDSDAVPALIDLLRDDLPAVQQEAIHALEALGDERAREPLKRLLRAPASEAIETRAKRALAALRDAPLAAAPDDGGAPPAPPVTDSDVQQELMRLHHADWRIRRDAILALGQRHDPKLREPLLDCLNDPDWEVRLQAVQTLQTIRNQEVTKALVLMMSDSVSEVAEAAMRFAESVGVEALEPLATLLGATDVDAREHAVRLLGKIPENRVIAPLLRALRDSDEHVRQVAAAALRERGQAVADNLAQAAESADSDARWKAVDAMSRLRDARMIPALVTALDDREDDIRELAAQALAALNWQPDQPRDHIAYAIASSDWEALPPFGAQAVPLLLRFVDDGNVRVRRYIHEALEQACAQVKTLIFGDPAGRDFDPTATLVNLDVAALPYPLTKLQALLVYPDSYELLLIERFFTYAVNILGEKFLQKNVTVTVRGPAAHLDAHLLNSFKNLCKRVHEEHV